MVIIIIIIEINIQCIPFYWSLLFSKSFWILKLTGFIEGTGGAMQEPSTGLKTDSWTENSLAADPIALRRLKSLFNVSWLLIWANKLASNEDEEDMIIKISILLGDFLIYLILIAFATINNLFYFFVFSRSTSWLSSSFSSLSSYLKMPKSLVGASINRAKVIA